MAVRRKGEAGILRGCCAGLLTLVLLVAASLWIINQALAEPDLGPAPAADPRDGSGTAIASRLAAELARDFNSQAAHATVVLSPWDLTVLAREHNPDPQRFSGLFAHLADGQILLSAQAAAGPLSATAVETLQVHLNQAGNIVATQLTNLRLGRLQLPKPLWGVLEPGADAALSVGSVVDEASLRPYGTQLECVSVRDDGVHLGFHRLGVSADPNAC